MSKDEIIAQIEAAFANTPPPGSDFKDISATSWDEGIVGYFRGKTWRGHQVRDLRHNDAALSFFTEKAFRYWLPAFMLAELQSPEEADVIAEGITSSLINGESANLRLQQFTPVEFEAIVAFLDECARRYDDEIFGVRFRNAVSAVRARLL